MKQVNTESRRKNILNAIVDSYIENAVPVGSRFISQRFRWTMSPATIRNVMADLEELGLITHPHTSAGRVPTDKGYRVYVDSILEPKHLTKDEEEAIAKLFSKKLDDFDHLMQKTSAAINMITNVVGVVITPRLKRSTFKHIEFILVDSSHILAVLMTGTGFVKNSVLEAEDDITRNELFRISEFLNDELDGMFLGEVKQYLTQRLLEHTDSFYNFLKKAERILSTADLLRSEDRIYFDGATSLMLNPEFKDVKKARSFFKIFEEKRDIIDLFSEDMEQDGVKVHIGKENSSKSVQDCAIVTCNYNIKGHAVGALGAVGPTRMEYGKIISCVRYLSGILGKALEDLG